MRKQSWSGVRAYLFKYHRKTDASLVPHFLYLYYDIFPFFPPRRNHPSEFFNHFFVFQFSIFIIPIFFSSCYHFYRKSNRKEKKEKNVKEEDGWGREREGEREGREGGREEICLAIIENLEGMERGWKRWREGWRGGEGKGGKRRGGEERRGGRKVGRKVGRERGRDGERPSAYQLLRS